MFWALATIVVLLVVLVRLHQRNRLLTTENSRWRELARQRADQGAMLGHEVRTPLALIGGAAELMADGTAGELTDTQAELMDTITVNTARIRTLTDDLLAEARIDAGLFSMHMHAVNMRSLALSVIRDVRRLEHARIRFECRGAPPRMPGDPDLLRQVLVNLINNAVRHAGPSALVTVTLRTGDDMLLVSVRDDGAGMTPQTQQALFRRTLEGKSETGHGLGMIISKKIVEMHGGRIMVDSISHRGTTITVSLPLADPEERV